MSGLLGKLKDKVRHRSDSASSDQAPSRKSTEIRQSMEGRPSQDIPTHQRSAIPPVPPTPSAFITHRGRPSTDAQVLRPEPPPKDDIVRHQRTNDRVEQQRSGANVNEQTAQPLIGRKSLDVRHRKTGSVGVPENVVRDTFPERTSSKVVGSGASELQPSTQGVVSTPVQRKSLDHTAQHTQLPYRTSARNISDSVPSVMQTNGSGKADAERYQHSGSVTLSRPATTSNDVVQTSRNAPQPNRTGTSDFVDSAHLAGKYLEKSESDIAKDRAIASGNLRLPEGFSLRDTEETIVYEEQRPAVTHETIVQQRTEVLQEEITRDIHIHHYYTYLQPVKVVEVLPARHFFLHPVTGVKTEVQPPVGWQMPSNMLPSKATDISNVKSWSRHYVVDEANPTGLFESPPSKEELIRHDTREEALAAGYTYA